MITSNCQQCNKEYKFKPYLLGKSKYCSNPCRAKGINNFGQANPNYRGGKTLCLECHKQLAQRYSFRDTKYCHKCAIKGDRHPNWKGGITPLRTKIWKSEEYQNWRNSVFKRDGYRCVECGDNSGGNLEADHIKPFAYFPNLRFLVKNGRTLCKLCHSKTETFRGRATKLYGPAK